MVGGENAVVYAFVVSVLGCRVEYFMSQEQKDRDTNSRKRQATRMVAGGKSQARYPFFLYLPLPSTGSARCDSPPISCPDHTG